ncbi:MAG: ferrochelatase [Pseudonocardiales bacterium]|nr:ferrochelatase [Pseudonocardiales bacterium]
MPEGPYDALLLVGFGGPEGMADVMPFLENVTRGRGIPPERLIEVSHHYEHFNGVSPINDQNRALIAALEAELAKRDLDLPILWGNRNWDPYLHEAMTAAHEAGYTRVLALVTSAYSSYSSCRQYREDFADALATSGLDGKLAIDRVRQYFDHPGFVAPFAEGLAAAVASLQAEVGEDAPLEILFTTHSIPDSMGLSSGPPARHDHRPDAPVGGMYEAQHLETAALIVDEAQTLSGIDMPDWRLVYQSRSGPPSMPWLEPDINDAVRAAAASGMRGVVVVPSGFVSDHLEVLWDLDEEARETAQEVGIAFARVATAGTHPAFITGLVDLIQERLDPAAPVSALSDLGPWPAVCAPGCCANLRVRKAAAVGSDDGAVFTRTDDGFRIEVTAL